jgi:hypothetical protein
VRVSPHSAHEAWLLIMTGFTAGIHLFGALTLTALDMLTIRLLIIRA